MRPIGLQPEQRATPWGGHVSVHETLFEPLSQQFATAAIAATVLLSATVDCISRKLRDALRIGLLPVRVAKALSDRVNSTVGAAA